jgi:hypothetical protein
VSEFVSKMSYRQGDSQVDLSTLNANDVAEDEFRKLALNDLDDIDDEEEVEVRKKKKGLFGMGRVGKGIAKRSAKIGGWFSSSSSNNDETEERLALVLGCR